MAVNTRNGIYGTPPIVTNGLILYLDAANSKSYTSGSTVWNDLSGRNNSGSLINGPTFSRDNGGSIRFDGVNDFCNLSTRFNYTTQSFTFSYWVFFNSLTTNQVNQGPIVLWKGNYRVNGYYDQINANGTISFVTNQSGADQTTSTNNSLVSTNTWCNIAYTRSGSSIRVYFNGIDRTSSAATHINPTSAISNNFNIAVYGVNNIWGNFRLANFTGYDRALSAQEITQNYNATKTRFNLL